MAANSSRQRLKKQDYFARYNVVRNYVPNASQPRTKSPT